jgi:hypothetical protein
MYRNEKPPGMDLAGEAKVMPTGNRGIGLIVGQGLTHIHLQKRLKNFRKFF